MEKPYIDENGESKYLCVLIHGYGSSKSDFIQQKIPKFNAYNRVVNLKEIIKDNQGYNNSAITNDIDIYCPNITKEISILSTCDLNHLVNEILQNIDSIFQLRAYEKIYLVGYSMGAILTRKIYVCACGSNNEAPLEKCFEQKPREWADKVNRIILLAGVNRGWTINHHLSLPTSILWTLGAGCGNLIMLFGRPKPVIFQIRKGSSFLIQLCIQWIYMRRKAANKGIGDALTIQLLGTKDNLVSPEDNIDPISGKDFVYLEVPFSDHSSVLKMKAPTSSDPKKWSVEEKRGKVFLTALTEIDENLKAQSRQLMIDPESSNFTNITVSHNPAEITDVIFVIHGIRDEGHWTNKIAQRIILENKAANKSRDQDKQRYFAIETSRYGYFPMLLFALPWTRRGKVSWFMEQYAENLALYPNAQFSFVGHSNGTYLLAQALEKYQCCRFKRIVFAGSVVPKEYKWSKYIDNKRVERVLNYVATFDWVVAIFPNFLNKIQPDLGSAGHHGFLQDHEQVVNIEYLKGQHGAALSEYNWDVIAKFIVSDSAELPTSEDLRPPEVFQSSRGEYSPKIKLAQVLEILLEIIGQFPGIIWLMITTILIVIALCILFVLSLREWQKTVIFMAYLGVIWKILTKI